MGHYDTGRSPVGIYRCERPTGALAQTGDLSLFTVTGYIRAICLFGHVTTIIQNQANATLIKMNPTTGADVDLCAALDIANHAAGSGYTVTGDFSDALQYEASACLEGETSLQPFILPPGVIELECAASNTGAVQWTLLYQKITSDAGVVVA